MVTCPPPHIRSLPLKRTRSATMMYGSRSEEHTSELQTQSNLVCRLLLEKHNYRDSATGDAERRDRAPPEHEARGHRDQDRRAPQTDHARDRHLSSTADHPRQRIDDPVQD